MKERGGSSVFAKAFTIRAKWCILTRGLSDQSKEDANMTLVSAKDMLNKAAKEGYAVGQFNINNLEWTKAVLLTAQELKAPVILGVSEGAGKYMCGYKTVAAMVKAMVESLNITVPVALHLDHGSYEGAKACIEAGFSSIMFDGSHYPIEENIERPRSSRPSATPRAFRWRRRSGPSAARKTAWSAVAKSRIRPNASASRTWA